MSRSITPPPTKRRKTSHTTRQESPKILAPSPSSPPPPPDSEVLRVYSWNVNGILPFLQRPITTYFDPVSIRGSTSKQTSHHRPAPASLRGFLHKHHYPAVLFLQEVKISAQDLKTQDAVCQAVNTPLATQKSGTLEPATYDVHFTLPRDRFNARGPGGTGKVYGVCSIVRSDLKTKPGVRVNARTVDWDAEGRVSIVEICCDSSDASPALCSSPTSQTKLALFNIYAVNGTDNVYKNPSTGAICGTRHDRKLEFHRLLMQECISMEEHGWHVVLAGDMNVAPKQIDGWPNLRTWPRQHVINRADFNEKFLSRGKYKTNNGKDEVGQEENSDVKRWQGIDVWREMHPEERRYTYHPPNREWGTSCDRVDYVIASKKFYDDGLVTAAGMLDSEVGRGPSDHVPIWVDVRIGLGSSSGENDAGTIDKA